MDIKNTKWLYDLGFALHSLYPKSKIPKAHNWSKGPRLSWEEFLILHEDGDNIGVRAGEPSQFKDGSYLIILDIDVKSSDPEDAKKAYAVAENFIGKKLTKLPAVSSGRGGFSLHVYARCFDPMASFNLVRSEKMCKVLMPSVKAGKKEAEELEADEVKKGWRLRPAFEIDILGTGKQAAIPDAIHPDTGKAYKWRTPIAYFTDMPEIQSSKFKSVNKKESKAVSTVTEKAVDIQTLGLSNKALLLIESMEGLEAHGSDRSAALFGVLAELVLKGLDDDTIVSVVSDPFNAISEVVIDRVGAGFDKCAAWILPQIEKIRLNHSVEAQFKDEPDLLEGTDWALPIDNSKVVEDMELWRTNLDKTDKGGTKMNLKNVSLYLRNVAKVNDWLGRNLFTGEIEFLKAPPWEKKKSDEECKHTLLGDSDVVEARLYLSRKEKYEPNQNLMLEGLVSCAKLNAFHPVRDWLESLKWDGVSRLDNWLHTYLKVADTEYTRAVGRKLLGAMIKRVYEPGCKFDCVVILEGTQGIGKSTALDILSRPWFCDSLGDVTNKDVIQQMQGAWIVEIGELAGLRKTELNAFKEFVSRREDKARLAYQRLAVKFPRQCVFVGSTNDDEYLKDPTGNRRFWPVELLGKVDLKGLERDKDNLWAEALLAHKENPEKLWMSGAFLKKAHADVTNSKMLSDPWEDIFADEIKARISKMNGKASVPGAYFETRLVDFMSQTLGKNAAQITKGDQMRGASCFKKMGLNKIRGEKTSTWRMFLKT